MQSKSLLSMTLAAAAVALSASFASAEVLPDTFGAGLDFVLRENDAVENDQFLRIKNQSAADGAEITNDRVPFIKFDASGLTEAVTAASVRLELPRTAASNNFDAGETIYLYGVPDGHADEDFDETDWVFSTSPFIGLGVGDLTNNNVDDTVATLLAQITFAANTSGGFVDFFGTAVSAFVAADSNDILSFIVTLEEPTNAGDTVVFNSDTFTEGTIAPTLLTNGDAIVPEPASLALLGLGSLALIIRRRRSA